MAGCDDHRASRRQLLQAAAGRGLPAIEPGQPIPAGSGLDRRAFLLRAAGLSLTVFGASRLGFDALEAGVANAAAAPPTDPVLVTVFLDGGMDALHLLAPINDPIYTSLRPTLKLGAGDVSGAFAPDPRLYWNSKVDGLRTLHAEGKVTVLPGIGYAHPNQSHFTSRHFWEVGALDERLLTGWMGRYLDVHGAPDNPLQGLALDGQLSPALATASVPVAAVSRPDAYTFGAPWVSDPVASKLAVALGDVAAPVAGDDAQLAQARGAQAAAARLAAQLAGVGTPTPPVAYPTGNSFPQRLQGLAGLLDAGLPLRCVALSGAGGYDTHSDQRTDLDANLQMTFDSLLAFQRDLEARGLADRVITLVWSEFGRRVAQNDTGTDHGAGGAAFVIGSRASGATVGEWPGLGSLDHGNLLHTSDFRAVYCTLIEQWLGHDAGPVIPGADAFARLGLLK